MFSTSPNTGRISWMKHNRKLVKYVMLLTRWGRVTHVCVGLLTNIGSDKGLSPGRRQAIIWTNARILLIGPLGTNNEFQIVIYTFSFNKMRLKVSSILSRPQCVKWNTIVGPSPRFAQATTDNMWGHAQIGWITDIKLRTWIIFSKCKLRTYKPFAKGATGWLSKSVRMTNPFFNIYRLPPF